MPISPSDLAALRTPPPAPDVVGDADRAAYRAIPPLVDQQLQSVAADPLGYYPVVIPPEEAAVLLAHPSLARELSDAYADVGWRVAVAQGRPDGSFLLTLAPPAGRTAPAAL